jgi:peptidyl-tRNA hydrolase
MSDYAREEIRKLRAPISSPLTADVVGSRVAACHNNGPTSSSHYVIVRKDMPIGFLAAQVVHAAGESSPGNLNEGTNAVVLAVDNEQQLLQLARRLALTGVAHVVIHEPDPPWLGQATAIGLVPVADRAPLRPLLSNLPLFGKEPPCPDCTAKQPCYTCNGGLRRVRSTM